MTALPRQAAIPYLFIMPWIIGFLAFTLGPLVFSLVISFYEWPIVGEKTFVGIANYVEMFRGDLSSGPRSG